MQWLNNLFNVCWKRKKADVICNKFTPLVSLWQGIVQKYKKIDENRWKSMKIANTDREGLLNAWRNSMKFSGKMWLMIILKITKNQGFTLSLEDTILEKPQGRSNWPPSLLFPPNLFRVNVVLMTKIENTQWNRVTNRSA